MNRQTLQDVKTLVNAKKKMKAKARRNVKRALSAGAAFAMALLVVAILVSAVSGGSIGSITATFGGIEPNATVIEGIDGDNPVYEVYATAAQRNDRDVPWTILAALATVQTDQGRYSPYDNIDRDPGRSAEVFTNDAGETYTPEWKRPSTSTTVSVAGGSSVLIAGGSEAAAAEQALASGFQAAGWQHSVEGIPGRTVAELAESWSERTDFPENVVVTVGAADRSDPRTLRGGLDDIAAAVGSNRQLWFVNAAGPSETVGVTNDLIALAGNATDITIDWQSAATPQGDRWMTADGTFTDGGAAAYGTKIADTVTGYRVTVGSGAQAGNTGGPGVAIVGDSIGVGVSAALDTVGGQPVKLNDTEVGRTTSEGADVLAAATLPGTVVVALGTNDWTAPDEFPTQIDDVMNAIGPGRQVVWLEVVDRAEDRDDAMNDHLAKAASRWSNLMLVDWGADVPAADMQSDGIHPTGNGYAKIAEAVSTRVTALTGNSSAPGADNGPDGTGVAFPTISPPIGGEAGQGAGPFLVDIGALESTGDAPPSDPQNYEAAVDWMADRIARTMAVVESLGFERPAQGSSTEAADAYWLEVVTRLPILDPASGTNCEVTVDQPVAELISTIWRCEALAYQTLNVASELLEGTDGSFQYGVFEPTFALPRIVDDAYSVAWAWSGWGEDLNGPAAGSACDPAGAEAGVFPLTATQFNEAVDEDDKARGADRCDAIANIRSAARIVLARASTPVSDQSGDGWERMQHPWKTIPYAIGPETTASAFATDGPATFATNFACRTAIGDWVVDVAAGQQTFADIGASEAMVTDAHLTAAQLLWIAETDPRAGLCINYAANPIDFQTQVALVISNLDDDDFATQAVESETDSTATSTSTTAAPVADPAVSGTAAGMTDDDTPAADSFGGAVREGLRRYVDQYLLPEPGQDPAAATQLLTTARSRISSNARATVGERALIERLSPTLLPWSLPAVPSVAAPSATLDGIARSAVSHAVLYGGLYPDDPRAFSLPDVATLGGGGPITAEQLASIEVEGHNGGHIPVGLTAAQAYLNAVSYNAAVNPECQVPLSVLMGIGYVESAHGTYLGRSLLPNGDQVPPLLGIELNGSKSKVIRDTDGGRYDNNTVYDHALGPMQFLPGTWTNSYGVDGDGDGDADPFNYFDATAAAAAHLCGGRSGMVKDFADQGNTQDVDPDNDEPVVVKALFTYNKSKKYGQDVLLMAERYEAAIATVTAASASFGTGGSPIEVAVPTRPPDVVAVQGITVDVSIASNLDGLLTHAASDGVPLSGWGYRSTQRQIELRAINGCPPDLYASASLCRTPTAPPGRSMHEIGLAVDFTYQGSTIQSRSSAAFVWMAANAAQYGFYNLPSEPWHWSVNGH